MQKSGEFVLLSALIAIVNTALNAQIRPHSLLLSLTDTEPNYLVLVKISQENYVMPGITRLLIISGILFFLPIQFI